VIGRTRQARRGAAIALAGTALLTGAVVLGWNAGEPTAARETGAAAASWALPQQQRSDTEADAGVLRARRPWGGNGAFRDTEGLAPPPAVVPWKLVGTVARDDGRFALIQVGPQQGGKLEYRGIGDRLPDSSIVIQIEPDSITTREGADLAAAPIVHRLFQKKS
jgi:hypothetical protein